MGAILWVVGFIGAVWALAYFRISHFIWTPTVIFLIFLLTFVSPVPWWFCLLLWVVFGALIAFLEIPTLRIRYISQPLLAFVRQVLPPMSRTEKEAIEAGHVWWEGDLFRGKPDWKNFLSQPKPSLTSEEQAFLSNQVEAVCAMTDDWKIVQEDWDIPKEMWAYLKKEGFFGMAIPKQYGGLGFSALAHSAVIVKLATRSVSVAVNSMVPNSLGPGELILHYGTQEQKQYYLPRLARGEEIPCFALTSVEAGSDAASISDSGVICRDKFEGKEVLGIRLNCEKRYITLAPIATVISVAFKLYDPDGLFKKKKDLGITVALIPTALSGVEVGTRHFPLGAAFLNGPIRIKNVFIPLDYIVGGPDMAGSGWQMLMECLSVGRAISLPALSTATGQFCYRSTGAYARVRKQFGTPIGKFEGVEEILARIGSSTYLLEATRILSVSAVDRGVKPAVVSAISKYHMTELLRKVIDCAMDIHGGKGIQMGPRNYIAPNYMSAPLAITVEGANILTRNLIIFGQGAILCHPYLRDEMAAAQNKDPKEGLRKFDRLLFSHMGYTVRNFARALAMGVSNARFVLSPVVGEMGAYYRHITRMSSAFAFVSDITMLLLGGKLKRRERLSARLGDILSYLYLGTAVLKYYEDHQRQPADAPYVHFVLQTLLHDTQSVFIDFFNNFPNRWVGNFLRFVVFPWGRVYKLPRDKLGRAIAAHMQEESALRDRLTQYCYVPSSSDDGIGRIEHAFQLCLRVDPLEKKLQAAVRGDILPKGLLFEEKMAQALSKGVLVESEVKLLRECHAAYLDAIQVDEFSFDQLKRKMSHAKSKK